MQRSSLYRGSNVCGFKNIRIRVHKAYIILALNRFLPHFERVVVLKSKEAGSFSVHCMELTASVKYIIGYVLELHFRHAKDTFCTHFCEP